MTVTETRAMAVPDEKKPLAVTRRGKVGQERTNWVATTLLVLSAITVLVPLYVTLTMAFKTPEQALDKNAFSLPAPFDFSNFEKASTLVNFPQALAVSIFITVLAVAGEIIISALLSYAIVRGWDRKWVRWAFYYVLIALFIPFPVVALPQVQLTGWLGLANPFGVVLLHIAFALAFNMLLFTTFLRSIPYELEESARLDGASTMQVFWQIILPLLAPMAATVGIFAFLSTWNDFMMPSLIISDPSMQTIPVVQNIFKNQLSNNYNVSFASYLMAMAPAIIAYVFTQKWVVAGVTQGSLK